MTRSSTWRARTGRSRSSIPRRWRRRRRSHWRATAPFGLAVTPDDAQIYVASGATHNLTILDRSSHSVLKTVPLNGLPRRIAFNAFGNKAYIANEGNWIDVVE